MMKHFEKSISVIFLGLVLASCGGGGGSATVIPNSDPQGYWSGPSSSGYTVNAVVLSSGETWGIYSSGSTIYGGLYGSTATNGNSVSINGTDFNYTTNSSSPGSLTGTIVSKASMSLSGSGVTLPLTYQSTYDTPSTYSAVSGTWSFIGRSSNYNLVPGSVTVDASGNFVLNQTNCVTTGSILPNSGGKNVYTVNLSSAGNGCAAGQSSLSGVMYLDTTVTPNKFLALALTSSKNNGLIVIGTKH